MWDHAGGVLIFEEAGGKVTDLDGKVSTPILSQLLRTSADKAVIRFRQSISAQGERWPTVRIPSVLER